MEGGEGSAGGPLRHKKSECPFCKEPDLLNYHTKHGKIKDEDVLGDNLAASGKKDITSDPEVGNIYPLPGGNDPTAGWVCDEGLFKNKKGDPIDEELFIPATPHHLIPGKGAMAGHAIETWTLKNGKGKKIKQDIGYSIDAAPNGIFLPRIPEAYFTNTIEVPSKRNPKKMVKMKMTKFYETKPWGQLSDAEKKSISFRIMIETQLQFHQTSHGAGYLSAPTKSYDKEARELCDNLANIMRSKAAVCPQKDSDDKFNPPYSLVGMINGESAELKKRITGHPKDWKSWVTRLSEKLTLDAKAGKEKCIAVGKINRANGDDT